MKKKILVTGGAGFIGSSLIEYLLKNSDYQIYSLDCYFTGKKENHIKNVNYIKGYTWDIFEIFNDVKFDIIFHFGEYSRIVKSFEDIEFVTNSILRGTPKVLEFARKNNSKVVYSASSSKFGNDGKDENLSPYAWMKSKMVELIKNYNTWFNLKYEICYFFNVYGPRQIYKGDYATVIAIFEEQFKNKKNLTVVKPGTQSRDFTHIDDVVSGIFKTSQIDMNHEWHLRSGKNYSIIQVAELFTKNWIYISERNGERFTSEEFKSDTNKLLNWHPKKSLTKWIEKVKNE
jgi:UDP-glucose 4-epimerase